MYIFDVTHMYEMYSNADDYVFNRERFMKNQHKVSILNILKFNTTLSYTDYTVWETHYRLIDARADERLYPFYLKYEALVFFLRNYKYRCVKAKLNKRFHAKVRLAQKLDTNHLLFSHYFIFSDKFRLETINAAYRVQKKLEAERNKRYQWVRYINPIVFFKKIGEFFKKKKKYNFHTYNHFKDDQGLRQSQYTWLEELVFCIKRCGGGPDKMPRHIREKMEYLRNLDK